MRAHAHLRDFGSNLPSRSSIQRLGIVYNFSRVASRELCLRARFREKGYAEKRKFNPELLRKGVKTIENLFSG